MERPRALRSPGAALVRTALIAVALTAGPGVSALGVARSMRFRARPYLLAPTGAPRHAGPARGVPTPGVPTRATPTAGPARRAGPAAPARLPLPLPASALPEAVRQSDARSCGPAALATVLAWQGRPVGESTVLARARLRADGVTLAELARLAAAFDLPGSWYAVPWRDLPRLPAPFLAHLRTDGGHYVAVAQVARGFVLLADPALGIELLRVSAFRRAWSGRVLLFRGLEQGSPR